MIWFIICWLVVGLVVTSLSIYGPTKKNAEDFLKEAGVTKGEALVFGALAAPAIALSYLIRKVLGGRF